jgi:hypothetical protein
MRHPSIHGPEELAGAVPTLLGYAPRESVVIVGLDPKSAIAAIIRADVADLLALDAGEALVHSINAQLARHGSTSAVALTYSARGYDDMRQISDRVADLTGTVEHFHVLGESVTVVLPDGRETMPRGVVVPGALVSIMAEGDVAVAEPADVFDVRYAASVAEKRTASRHSKAWWDKREANPTTWRTESYAAWTAALRAVTENGPSEAVSAQTAGRLLAAVADRRVRDAILVALLGHGDLATTTLLGTGDGEVARALGTLLSPTDGTPPDVEALRPAWRLLMLLDGHAAKAARAPIVTLAAVLKWWNDDTAAATELLAAAHASEPGYRLAGLLETTILAGIRAGWVRREQGEGTRKVG